MKDREIAAVGKHAPHPFQRAEAEIAKPQPADDYLEEEHDDGRQFDGDEAEGSAQSQAQAVEQEYADNRLHDVARQGHPSRQAKGREPGRAPQEQQTDSRDIGERHGHDAHGVEQRVVGQTVNKKGKIVQKFVVAKTLVKDVAFEETYDTSMQPEPESGNGGGGGNG